MRIAQVAPLFEAVPPRLYGGTERIVSYLTEELVSLGHDVTLFASGDSETSARLVATCETATRLTPACQDPLVYHVLMLEEVMQRRHHFDIVHFHCDYIHYPWSRRSTVPTLTTVHGRLDLPDLEPLYREFVDIPLVSISADQRRPLPWANWQGTVHHGLPEELFSYRPGDGGYLAFLGRMSPEKRPDRAVDIARRTGIPVKMAAKVDGADLAYFEQVIKPLLADPLVHFIGEIGEAEKNDFLGGARALLFPIDWPEPFGVVMIEAMACGTPVIAWRSGSVPEVVEDGITGIVVDDLEAAVAAVHKVAALDRQACRRRFVERFSARRMAGDYLRLYEKLARHTVSPLRPHTV